MFRYSVLLLLSATATLSAHPFHQSIAEAEWKPRTNTLEVALRVHPSDLEKVLRLRAKKAIHLDKDTEADALIVKYLDDTFVIRRGEGDPLPLKWVGKEVSVKEAWLYFEIVVPQGLEGITFSNRIFFEILNDQVNTITIRDKSAMVRKSMTFSAGHPTRSFSWKKSN